MHKCAQCCTLSGLMRPRPNRHHAVCKRRAACASSVLCVQAPYSTVHRRKRSLPAPGRSMMQMMRMMDQMQENNLMMQNMMHDCGMPGGACPTLPINSPQNWS